MRATVCTPPETDLSVAADRRYRVQFCREIALGTLKIWGIASVFIGKVHSVPQRKSPAVSRANSLLAISETNLLIKRSSNVNRTSNCTTYHWVVTDTEESHHLNVCWNRRQTEGRANSFVLPRCEGGKARRA